MMYVNQKHTSEEINDKSIMLEIKLPREIDKSPLAMEMVLSNLTQGGGLGHWYALGMKGNLPATFSLEIASLEGVIHFYIRTHKKFKELLSASLYAHYPGVEVIEVPDYTASIPRYEHRRKNGVSMWGNSYKLQKDHVIEKKKEKEKIGFIAKHLFRDEPEDDNDVDKSVKVPLDVFPMRTYVDLKLDKEKEEMKVDPLVSILEFFGSIGKGEYVALQILVQDESVHNGTKAPFIFMNKDTHKGIKTGQLADEYKDKLRGKKTFKKGEAVLDQYKNKVTRGTGDEKIDITYGEETVTYDGENTLTVEAKNNIELVERKMSKPLLACVARCIYVTSKDTKFNGNYVQNVMSLFKPFNAPGFNTMGPKAYADPYDFSWKNPNNMRSDFRAEEIFDAFIEREGFHPHTGTIDYLSGKNPDADIAFYRYPTYVRRTVTMILEGIFDPFGHPTPDEVFVLNTEELATIFHLPGLVATVPTLPRIDSRKAVAPVNLPI